MLSVSVLLLFNLKHLKLKYSWFKYSISFKCTTQWFNIFTDYTPFKVIMKHWLYSLCCTVFSYSLKVLVVPSCLTLCNSMDCSLPGSPVLGILQARILEWVAISFSRGSSQPRDQTRISCIAGRSFIIWVTKEALPW